MQKKEKNRYILFTAAAYRWKAWLARCTRKNRKSRADYSAHATPTYQLGKTKMEKLKRPLAAYGTPVQVQKNGGTGLCRPSKYGGSPWPGACTMGENVRA